MKPLSVPIVRLPQPRNMPLVPLPSAATEGAAGLDLVATCLAQVRLQPGDRTLMTTGISIAVPEGYEAQVRARSGLALEFGLGLANGVGTIDSDYRGEIKLILQNMGAEEMTITRGERIGQLVFAPVAHVAWQEVDALPETTRGTKGLGSTGK